MIKDKYCAHINLGPWNRMQRYFPTIGAAVDYFRSEIRGEDFGTGTEDQVIDLYIAKDQHSDEKCECNESENYHDYPLVRYSVGPRGGVVRENC